MSTLQHVPFDCADATIYRYVLHGRRHLQLTMTLSPRQDPAQQPWELYFEDVYNFGCLRNFLDSYVESQEGATAEERLCQCTMNGLVYNQKRFSRENDLFLILRLEGAGFKLNCRAFRFVNPALETFVPQAAPEFQNKGDCE